MNQRNWGPSCGTFIPPFVDVMVPDGPAYVWLILVLNEDNDLSFERWGGEVWAAAKPETPPPPDDPEDLQSQWDVLKFGLPSEDHEWLSEEISNSGWDQLLDVTDYNRRTEYDFNFEVIQWALENGIAPDQPFLVRIDVPYGFRSSYEYDEWDVEFNYEIITVTPLDPKEAARRWKNDILDRMLAERCLAGAREDAANALYDHRHPVIEEAVKAYQEDHPERVLKPANEVAQMLYGRRRNNPVIEEAVKAYREDHPCKTCGGTGTYEDDATGALGYLVRKACPDCSVKVLDPAEDSLLRRLPPV